MTQWNRTRPLGRTRVAGTRTLLHLSKKRPVRKDWMFNPSGSGPTFHHCITDMGTRTVRLRMKGLLVGYFRSRVFPWNSYLDNGRFAICGFHPTLNYLNIREFLLPDCKDWDIDSETKFCYFMHRSKGNSRFNYKVQWRLQDFSVLYFAKNPIKKRR